MSVNYNEPLKMANSVVAIEVLTANMRKLSEKDQSFARDLLHKFEMGWASVKQVWWIDQLAWRAQNGGRSQPAPAPVHLGHVQGVVDLFDAARSRLKFPKVRLTANGRPLVLSMAGPNSKTPGMINVTDGGRFGQNVWYGRINRDGIFQQSRRVDAETMAAVTKVLRFLATDPARVAAEYGRRTGNCCFCGRELTDPRSVAVGYGPICADHFSLPWGGTAEERAAATRQEAAEAPAEGSEEEAGEEVAADPMAPFRTRNPGQGDAELNDSLDDMLADTQEISRTYAIR